MFQVKSEEAQASYGRFMFEPLEQGYGQTLGSSLRRVLLSSLPGAAVTQVAITGLKHQFGTVKGIKEDGVDLLLNLKKLRVSYTGEKPVKLELVAQGSGEIRADQIKASSEVKIANPDLLIATLSDKKTKLEIEMQVESGIGYSSAEDRKTNKVGQIPLDADFSPIKRVNYKVEETRVGRLTNYDKLTVEIWTDGTISPEEALKKAAETLVSYVNQVASPVKVQQQDSTRAVPSSTNQKLSYLSVEELGLPTRITNALSKAGYETAGDLLTADKNDLAKVRNMGEKSIKVIEAALKEKGITWEK
ncbi:MAG: DNA-directed RNA polymerase subunit alpha [Candidatus Blackburnbacteria bacterium RIFCSPHIGHO2_02_FULL_39_13]|uniref:DNA-directed RNA polymerase subunit alpha n=1 Tax=Candidatus Blackburnbacteria bacterium RIFCSPLOWO2_01_FULL_40_20 TaxID=1797519 RepID=A0A1G1VCX7_9BACT|nr:MAG: DNA-directed RNA polymerase subunit alpha [Microgenomates group bacterium GW2011_GWA2_39_19]OGY07020.1 MAG: DNA-directed RNA polymerase subunit alpha [Candidatus Blackburnbacteria bacterium RIFCSPHIGHO2_01_FULL_40_17]OGY08533.1 MAG: DNA-directed RNA polymerase subunit alpha [Candidatus Blackburnbacteria bacterium RIFCSPHIGHO2_02_FULL_39_13]OGY13300.1 MAG: DNA-directed RNA polymerase subunit alpha [Candidatus Blackburnbacteria bacterium RIFCSPLOWO2_01_FULL_40_20]OGY14484.1 MAG: DNA-direc